VPKAAGITKPFHYPELLARIGVLLKRVSRVRESHLLRCGALTVNTLSREVHLEGKPVALSAKEFQLVATLASEPERVFTKADLLETVWGFRSQGRTRTGLLGWVGGVVLAVTEAGRPLRRPQRGTTPWVSRAGVGVAGVGSRRR
jgi:Transcriptional regulatory protein, C terminal